MEPLTIQVVISGILGHDSDVDMDMGFWITILWHVAIWSKKFYRHMVKRQVISIWCRNRDGTIHSSKPDFSALHFPWTMEYQTTDNKLPKNKSQVQANESVNSAACDGGD